MIRAFTFYLVVLLTVLIQADGLAQIGISGAPHPSAVLDLKSPNNDKAFYPPRLASAQRLAIPNPQAGAMVYDIDKGSLYLHNGQIWLPLAFSNSELPTSLSLTASDGAAGDRFGISVTVSGDYALVGAFSKIMGSNNQQGAAYVFVRSGSSWIQQQRLTASDGATNDYFGVSVALSGEHALVGAYNKTIGSSPRQGAVYVFVRSGTNWTQQQQLIISDGATNDYFGVSVALSNEYALIGAYIKTVGNNSFQGAAYMFVRSGTSWIQQQRLTASDGATNDYFGISVALSGERALVGALSKTIGVNERQGAAYVFVRSDSSWIQQQRLTASDGAANDQFGISVALSGERALVGAFSKTSGRNDKQGAAYMYMQLGGSWTQQRLTDNSPTETQNGYSVGLSKETYIIGGPGYQNLQGKLTIGPVN